MKIKITVLALTALLILPNLSYAEGRGQEYYKTKIKAHKATQKAENKAFRQSLKDLEPEARKNAVLNQREMQYQENMQFSEQIHSEKRSKLSDRLQERENLTDAQRQEIIEFNESMYEDAKAHRVEQHSENISFIKSSNFSDLSKEERKMLVKSHHDEQKQENKLFRESQKSKRKAHRANYKKE